ncbi:DUF2642 domain-containing protein [Sporosarcina sp. ACRSM]|uniref:DUF2642 domain-containing protein n=1 Tax=Sporosarcina sp. ACRSM TaxID=2918216 RepID=UPI001EF585F6|nr:DUF2642 domain-containing protein [Sporosarcina sp. ACRSM]MCG7337231.1 DUF2642 domain-containing protein [Sporosarcina sp. ACRSM]
MNKIIQNLIQEVIRIEISGKKKMNGTLIDMGSDMVVLFDGKDFVYIPLNHIRNFSLDRDNENEVQSPTELPSFVAEESKEDLAFEEVLTQAKGRIVEIYVTGNQTLHGTITGIMNNYLIFQSPVYKTMFIAIDHVKWLIPYAQSHTLYGLDYAAVSSQPHNETFARSFDSQVEKFKGAIVVLNIGDPKSYIGKINNVEDQIIEFQSARTSPVYLNMHHIKTLHVV